MQRQSWEQLPAKQLGGSTLPASVVWMSDSGNLSQVSHVQVVMRVTTILRSLVVASLVIAGSAIRASSQQVDVIRGQVVGPEGKPLEDAKVTATSLSGNVNRSARTDKNGRYTITFPGGEGDYFVEVAAIGYAARRFEVKRTADQEILVADARLLRAAGQLDTVRDSCCRREAPSRRWSARHSESCWTARST